MEEKKATYDKWELEVKDKLNEFIDNLLSVSKECNMATKYFHPVAEVYETHTEYDNSKVNGAELRIVFNFVQDLDKDKMNFI